MARSAGTAPADRFVPASKGSLKFDPNTLLSMVGGGTSREYRKKQIIFAQGAPANEMFYIQKGRIKLCVVSEQGKEAVIAILGEGEFFGEGCLAGQPLRIATASAVTDCSLVRLRKAPRSAHSITIRVFPSCSSRTCFRAISGSRKTWSISYLTRARSGWPGLLLLLANFGKDGKPEPVIPKVSQETLAEMIGTTRSRVSFFMNKFRKLGFIHYNGGLAVHSSLLSIVLRD